MKKRIGSCILIAALLFSSLSGYAAETETPDESPSQLVKEDGEVQTETKDTEVFESDIETGESETKETSDKLSGFAEETSNRPLDSSVNVETAEEEVEPPSDSQSENIPEQEESLYEKTEEDEIKAVQSDETIAEDLEAEAETESETTTGGYIDFSDKINRNGGYSTVYFPADRVQPMSNSVSVDEEITRCIEESIKAYKDEVDISQWKVESTDDNIEHIEGLLEDIINGNYRYFYVDYAIGWGKSPDGSIKNISIYYKDEYILSEKPLKLDENKIENKLAKLEAAVQSALSVVDANMSDVEKVLAIHDFIVRECDYDYENYEAGTVPESGHSMEGVFFDKKAVCDGYAEAFSTLMREVGIDSYYVASPSMAHAWNLVLLDDGHWYHVDCTQDDPVWVGNTGHFEGNNDYADEGYVSHRYFLKSDSEFKSLNHYGWEVDPDVPDAEVSGKFKGYCFYDNNVSMNYYNGYWYYLNFSTSFGAANKLIQSRVDGGEKKEYTLNMGAYYAYSIGGSLYYAASDKIMAMDLSGNNMETAVTAVALDIQTAYPGYEMREFTVRDGALNIVLYNRSTQKYKKEAFVPNPIYVAAKRLIMSETSLRLTSKGEQKRLTVEVLPENVTDKAVLWTSSNPKVAEVSSDGIVTATAEGAADIKATAKGTGKVTAVCKVTVKFSTKVSSVELSEKELVFTKVGEKKKLKATVKPDNADDKTLVWGCETGGIVEVDNDGTVTAISDSGTTYVTATSNSSGITAKCKVTVDVFSPAERINLSSDSITLKGKKSSAIILATVEPNNADDKEVKWSSSNSSIVKISSQNSGQAKITAVSNGTAYITAELAASNLKAVCKVTVSGIGGNSGGTSTEEKPEKDPVESFVERLYIEILGRNADDAGLKAWTEVLKSGKEQGAQVAKGFVDSDELKKRNLSDEQYIKALYRTFLNREADAGGLAAWKSVLEDGLSRMHVFKGFAESDEFTEICQSYGIIRGYASLTAPMDQNEGVTKFLVRCYRLCLGREADESGLNSWCLQILSGKNTAKEAAYGFVFSKEFKEKKLSDKEYIKVLYEVFMDRQADSAGLDSWVKVLKNGKSREHVFNGFADSNEFKEICADYGIK